MQQEAIAESGPEGFARAWLAQWRERGGDAMVAPDGKVQLGWRPQDGGAGGEADAFALDQARYRQAYHDGAMRTLLAMLDAYEAGNDAVLQAVRVSGAIAAGMTLQ
jgi:hypothetical protein